MEEDERNARKARSEVNRTSLSSVKATHVIEQSQRKRCDLRLTTITCQLCDGCDRTVVLYSWRIIALIAVGWRYVVQVSDQLLL